MMHYRLMGKSGLRVSEICLGTMTFGEDWKFGAAKEEAKAIFDAYCEAGGNFIDCANIYTNGTSESFIGEFVQAERRHFVLSGKYSLSTDADKINAGGNHRKSLRHAVEDSLKRLNTDYIDILWVHAWDGMTPIEETMRALDDLVRAGKILYIGASNMPAWVAAKAYMLAELRGWSSFIGLQAEYSLIERSAEHELLPMAEHSGMAVLGWAPLGGGVLGGNYRLQGTEVHIEDTSRGAWLNRERIDHQNMAVAQEVQIIAAETGSTPSQVALAWIRQNGRGVIPIMGARTLKQCHENLAALNIHLSEEHLTKLEQVSASEPLFPQKFLASPPFRRALFGQCEALLQKTPQKRNAANKTEIHAIATITAKPEKRAALAEAFRISFPQTRKKAGCLEYDFANPLQMEATGSRQANDNEIVLIERWQSREALESHLSDAGYRAWFNQIRPFIESASMQVLQKGEIAEPAEAM